MPFLLALLPVWNVLKAIMTGLFTFLSRPPGVYLLAAGLICLAVWWSGERGYKHGRDACEASHQAAAAREVHRQTMVFQAVGDRADVRTAKSVAKNLSNEKVLVHVKDQLEGLTDRNDECIPADIADGLRSLQ